MTHVFVVDDEALVAGGLVSTHVLVDAPVAPPAALHTATAPRDRHRPAVSRHHRWTVRRRVEHTA